MSNYGVGELPFSPLEGGCHAVTEAAGEAKDLHPVTRKSAIYYSNQTVLLRVIGLFASFDMTLVRDVPSEPRGVF